MSHEQYLESFLRALQRHFHSDDISGSMTAARVGLITRQVLGAPPQQSGFTQLKDVLTELERRGAIRTGANSKNAFAVWLSAANSGQTAAVPPTRVSGPYRRLRQGIWYALVAASPSGRRFVNRQSGEVRMGQESAPEPEDVWVEIQAVDQSAEKSDAEELLQHEGVEITPTIRAALDSDRWFSDLPRSLEPTLAARWKRHRTGRIVELAEKWRKETDFPAKFVYGDDSPPNAPRAKMLVRADLRQLLLAVVHGMSTEEILNLQLPSRALVAELRPDLLNH